MKLESLKSSKFEALSESKMSVIKGGEDRWQQTQPTGHMSAGSYVDYAFLKNGVEVCREYQMNNGSTVTYHWTTWK